MSKIEAFWVNATAFEVARVMAGETVEARFRDSEKAQWFISELAGWTAGAIQWYSTDNDYWTHCQVYREPSWYANKPDPGPGWRLLGKLPDEPKLATDEAWDCHSKEWRRTFANDGDQVKTVWYRRRSEPVEPKFAVGQMVKVVGPKEIPALEWSSVGMAQYAGTTQAIERVELLTNPPGTYYHLKGVVNWCFREDYLEPVEPEPKHYVLRVGDSVETPSGHRVQVISRGETQRTYALTAGGKVTLPNGQTITITEKGFEVTQ